MGNKFYLDLSCAYCTAKNKVLYTEECNFSGFKCSGCNRENIVTPDFSVKKVENVTPNEIYEGLVTATTDELTQAKKDKLWKDAVEYIKRLKKHNERIK